MDRMVKTAEGRGIFRGRDKHGYILIRMEKDVGKQKEYMPRLLRCLNWEVKWL